MTNTDNMKEIENIKYYTLREVADILKVCPMTIRRYIKKGHLQSIKLGIIYIRESEVDRLLREGTI